jgi:hypothetical protein
VIVDWAQPERLLALIRQYAGFGEHRTGGAADEATSAWLRARLGEAGFATAIEPFDFPRRTEGESFVSVDGATVRGTPLYDAGTTGPQGIEGRLARAADLKPGDIALLDSPEPQAVDALLDAGRCTGVILVTADPEGDAVLRNAERMGSPWRTPALQVARRDATPLDAGRPVRLVIDHAIVAGKASNVLADLPAPRGDGQVVLMTPKSGWYACAAERGGGIALTLGLAMLAAKMKDRRRHLRVLFTSGHELGHRGLLSYLAADPARRETPGFWLQLGASIGARNAAQMRVFTRDPELREWFARELERHGIAGVSLADADLRPHGESREVFDRPFLSMAGRHPWFHSRNDEPDRAVDAHSLARYGAAFGELLARLLA